MAWQEVPILAAGLLKALFPSPASRDPPGLSSLTRYKSLCPETWPTWDGRPQDGVAALLKHLGFKQEEYKLGR